MSHRVRLAPIVLAVVAALALGACGSSTKKKQKFAYVERPVETLYADATRAMERKRYDEAIEHFGEVERQHPYSAWARRAMLMKAFAQYQQNDYEEAVESLDQFISLHPGNKDAPYAYYLKAMCFYERIRDVGRDQEFTNNAVQALNDVVRRYPQTEYARDARLKLDLTFDHLAGKEMYIGRFYLKEGKHIAAINRFKKVVADYETTGHTPEALYRLVEAYMQIGIIDEARAAAAVLGHNYPGTNWYEDAYRIMAKNGVLEPGSKPKRSEKELAKLRKKQEKTEGKALKDNASPPVIEPPAGDPFDDEVESPANPNPGGA
jgi:outer membrane protein assembly factor BamD